MRLQFSDIERDLMMCALERWRWGIAEERGKPTFMDVGQQQACRFTVRRIDALMKRLKGPTIEETITTGKKLP